MSKKGLSRIQQEQIVIELACGIETMSDDEFEALYNELDIEYQLQVDQDVREFGNNAVGDEHYNPDED